MHSTDLSLFLPPWTPSMQLLHRIPVGSTCGMHMHVFNKPWIFLSLYNNHTVFFLSPFPVLIHTVLEIRQSTKDDLST